MPLKVGQHRLHGLQQPADAHKQCFSTPQPLLTGQGQMQFKHGKQKPLLSKEGR